jgi:hypothetical protein
MIASVDHCRACLNRGPPLLVCLGGIPIRQFFPKCGAGGTCDLLGELTRPEALERTLKQAGMGLEDVLASDYVSLDSR